jgi:hypothetical protein
MKLFSLEELMFDRFGKLLSACVATLVLLAFFVLRERRVVIGGAIASGVSLAGAAMWAWRHRPRGATEARD